MPIATATMAAGRIEAGLFGFVEGRPDGRSTLHEGHLAAARGGHRLHRRNRPFAPTAQARLLRLLETGIVSPVGGHRDDRLDVRIIAATRHNLVRRVEGGTFREDLFYRVNLIPVVIPPLRARPEDIASLARCRLDELSFERGLPALELDDELVEALVQYEWPGNVRQLHHCIERMAAGAEGGTLTVDDLHQALRDDLPVDAAPGNGSRDHTLAALEKRGRPGSHRGGQRPPRAGGRGAGHLGPHAPAQTQTVARRGA